MGAEHEMLVGFTFRICSQGERLTLAFNFFLRPLSEGRILTKMIYLSRKFCESQCVVMIDLERSIIWKHFRHLRHD